MRKVLGLWAVVLHPALVPAIRYNPTLGRGYFHSCPAASRHQSTVNSRPSTDVQSQEMRIMK